MKPKLFIGSSVESLPVANAIQCNLQFDCNATVWTQAVFKLSSTAIDDLLTALDNFDFAVFVFQPNDVTIMREQKVSSIRDNIIFELGLFIGRLGKEKVFFLTPADVTLHIPTDLLGMKPGMFEAEPADGNLQASVGPFCNDIRVFLNQFVVDYVNDLKNENAEVKRLIRDKPKGWEYLVAAEMIEVRLQPINDSYTELERGVVFQKQKIYSAEEYIQFYREGLEDLMKLLEVMPPVLNDFNIAMRPAGVPASMTELKHVANKLELWSKELLRWEYRLHSVVVSENLLKEAAQQCKGWTKPLFLQLFGLPQQIRTLIKDYVIGNQSEERQLQLVIQAPSNLDYVSNLIESYCHSLLT